jgi:pteridine reductase
MGHCPLAAKVALVTGAGRRVGQAIAVELGRAGCHVLVHHHTSTAGAEETCRRLAAVGAQCTPVRADLTDAAQTEALFRSLDAGPGGPDLLVLSAAIFDRRPFVEQSDEDFAHMIDANLLAPARVARLAARRMLKRGAGAIVSILDVGALQPWRGYAHYCSAKAGLQMLTRCLALELAPTIRVNGVAPGTVLFRDEEDAGLRERITKQIPLGHIGEPEDVAHAVRFLFEGSDFITGAMLAVDGGRLLRGGVEP